MQNVCRMALRLSGLRTTKPPVQRLPDGAALIRPMDSKAPCATSAGWRCAYPAYGQHSPVCNVCRMALRLTGLRTAKPPVQRLPDGAVLIRSTDSKARCVTSAGWRCAYRAYGHQSPLCNVCRMALRLSGLRTAKPPVQRLPDGAALIRPTKPLDPRRPDKAKPPSGRWSAQPKDRQSGLNKPPLKSRRESARRDRAAP